MWWIWPFFVDVNSFLARKKKFDRFYSTAKTLSYIRENARDSRRRDQLWNLKLGEGVNVGRTSWICVIFQFPIPFDSRQCPREKRVQTSHWFLSDSNSSHQHCGNIDKLIGLRRIFTVKSVHPIYLQKAAKWLWLSVGKPNEGIRSDPKWFVNIDVEWRFTFVNPWIGCWCWLAGKLRLEFLRFGSKL